MQISELLFLCNELCSPAKQKELNIPLRFISFAHIKGKMYNHFQNKSTFILQPDGVWGNQVIYGAIFMLDDFHYYIRLLDAYHSCSKSVLHRNHSRDMHHRSSATATLISFDTVNELATLQYKERDKIAVQTYFGNTNHPKITSRLNKTVSYRIYDGIHMPHFLKLLEEELS